MIEFVPVLPYLSLTTKKISPLQYMKNIHRTGNTITLDKMISEMYFGPSQTSMRKLYCENN